MYINRPGYSAGSCNGGPLPVGTWWPERALMYAKYATDWLSPPPGTRYGLYGHHSLRAARRLRIAARSRRAPARAACGIRISGGP